MPIAQCVADQQTKTTTECGNATARTAIYLTTNNAQTVENYTRELIHIVLNIWASIEEFPQLILHRDNRYDRVNGNPSLD